MIKNTRAFFSCTIVTTILTLVCCVFTNCDGRFGLGTFRSSVNEAGGVEGYGGMFVYEQLSPVSCIDGSFDQTRIVVTSTVSGFLNRSSCADVIPPKLLFNEVDYQISVVDP